MIGGGTTGSAITTPTGWACSEVFPARSVAVAVTRCSPSAQSVAGAHWNAPDALALARHIGAPLVASTTATDAPASAVPLITGCRSRVGEAGCSRTGAAGGVVSTTSARAALGLEAWPWPSPTCASRRYAPSASLLAGRQLQRPSASAAPAQRTASPR